MSANVRVNDYSERWLRKGFPWVYPKEVTKGRARPGDEVAVRGASGEVLGRGYYDDGWLRVRIFRHGDGPLDPDWIEAAAFGWLQAMKRLELSPSRRLMSPDAPGRMAYNGRKRLLLNPELTKTIPWPVTGVGTVMELIPLSSQSRLPDRSYDLTFPEPGVMISVRCWFSQTSGVDQLLRSLRSTFHTVLPVAQSIASMKECSSLSLTM